MTILDADFYPKLMKRLVGVDVVDAEEIILRARTIKSNEEISHVKEVARLCDTAYPKFLEFLKPGRREFEVLADLEHWFRLEGVEGVYFLISTGADPENKFQWIMDHKIERGDSIRVTWEICYAGGYWGQLVRTLSLGPPSSEEQAAFDTILEAQQLGVREMRVGKTALDVTKAIDDRINKSGYRQGNHIGHGMGLDVTERPILNLTDRSELKPGMVIELHPHAIVKRNPPGGAAWVGDMYLVRDSGPENLFETPKVFDNVFK
jgi:Xaa-Pro aminopeptidase